MKNDEVRDAFADADLLYSQYAALSDLSHLSVLGSQPDEIKNQVLHVGPILENGYVNAIVG